MGSGNGFCGNNDYFKYMEFAPVLKVGSRK